MIDPWQPGWFRDCVLALVAVTVLLWYGAAAPPDRPVGAGHRGARRGWPCSASSSPPSPRAAPTWPPCRRWPAAAGRHRRARRCRARSSACVAFAVAGAVAVLILAPTVLLFFPALGLATGGAAAFFAVLLGPGAAAAAGLPVASAAAARRPGCRRAVAGVLVLATVGRGARGRPRSTPSTRPRPSSCTRSTPTPARPGGSRPRRSRQRLDQPVRQRAGGPRRDLPDPGRATSPPGPPRRPTCRRPPSTLVADATTAGRRRLSLQVTPQRPVRLVYVEVQGETKVVHANVAGRPVPVEALPDAGFGIAIPRPAAGRGADHPGG